MVDEVRVSMQVTDEGEIRYVFRDLNADPGPRVRVAEPELEEQLAEEDSAFANIKHRKH